MNKYFYRIIACAVFLFPTVTQVHAQNSLAPAVQKQQKMIPTNMNKRIMATNARTNPSLSEQDKEDMFSSMIHKIRMAKMRISGGTGWEPTEWQKTLPPIAVQEGEATQDYIFTDLIKAEVTSALALHEPIRRFRLPCLSCTKTPRR
ncbi:MAG: hypothetical protein D3903_11175 [Candidatus Electrothrix sp. GM3_4]|nr:hypothetical protein [Candidatus Electrothrix sp. GM3_4]